MAVTKCICNERSFEEIRNYANKHQIDSIEELQAREICSCDCQMCEPYVKRMLKTGKTEFEPRNY